MVNRSGKRATPDRGKSLGLRKETKGKERLLPMQGGGKKTAKDVRKKMDQKIRAEAKKKPKGARARKRLGRPLCAKSEQGEKKKANGKENDEQT